MAGWLLQYAFILPCALRLMTDIQLCLLYIRSATYALLLCCALLITPWSRLNATFIYSCVIYALAWLFAVDECSGRHIRVVQQGLSCSGFCPRLLRQHASALLLFYAA